MPRRALGAGLVVDRWAVAGSIGTGRSFAQVDRYSAEVSDFVTRGVGSGIEELVFVGWLTPLVAIAGLVAVRRRRGLAVLLGLAALLPCLLALGANLPGYETLWRHVPGLDATRVPERFMPIACLALAALVAFAVDAGRTTLASRSPQARPAARRRGCRRAAGDRPAGAGVRRRCGRHAERRLRGDPREGAAARAARLPAGRPLRQRLPRVCAAEPAGAAAGLLDDRAETRRRTGARASSALLRPRNGARRPRRSLRRGAPRPLRAERLLRRRLP